MMDMVVKRLVLANTFSINMLPMLVGDAYKVLVERVTLTVAKELVDINRDRLHSVVGHESTAKFMSTLLGVEVPFNRELYKWKDGDLILATMLNFRPPEGKVYTYEELKRLYEEGNIAFYVVDVEKIT